MTSPKHDSSMTHVLGASEFIDDRPLFINELFVGLVLSSCAHAKIKVVNKKQVEALEGVEGVFTAKDFHANVWGTIFQDQPLLVEDETQYAGEVIAIIAARTEAALKAAKQLFKVNYKKLPAVLSIPQAIKEESFIASARSIVRGDVEKSLSTAPRKLEGEIHIAGAEHFYLEVQACIVYPQEQGRMEVHSSSQHPTEVQHVVSHALGLKSSDVVVIVKRMGGGFGGKESQSSPMAAYAALVAQKLNCPARLILEREEDMIATGKRNPFYIQYKVGFDEQGKILALDSKLYSDSGAYADLSTSIMERAMLHSDSAYFIPHMRVTGQVCRTNYHPHTAFRGFGGPKGVVALERIVEEIAFILNKDALEIRKLNCYQGTNNLTHYEQVVENNMLPELFSKCEERFDYFERRKAIDFYNQDSLGCDGEFLQGLSLTPVKFGISFTTRFLNQGNALVNVYRDGSVQVSTGATEMGQGAYRRISQVVASELGVQLEAVRVMPTSTEKNANTSPTAASSGTDINGAAAALAAQQIRRRLSELALQLFSKDQKLWARVTAPLGTEPEIEVVPNGGTQDISEVSLWQNVIFNEGRVFLKDVPDKCISFEELCNEAYLNRISLCEYAHYKFPGLSFDKINGKGDAFLYFTQGVAASQIQLNRRSGELKVLACDIQMDLGRPINHALDKGQISGAFVQGMGWLTTEKLFYQEGVLKSIGPSTYKIPSVHDIPREWNIEMINNPNNKVAIRASKAVGEPPLLLAISVWAAIENALSYQRKSLGEPFPKLNVPADSESILAELDPKAYKTMQEL